MIDESFLTITRISVIENFCSHIEFWYNHGRIFFQLINGNFIYFFILFFFNKMNIFNLKQTKSPVIRGIL